MNPLVMKQRYPGLVQQKARDGRDWYLQEYEDGTDFLPGESMEFRGEGDFAEVQSFQGFAEREGLCVKISKLGVEESPSKLKKLSVQMFKREVEALKRTKEHSISGVVSLVACTQWGDSNALILNDLGDLTLDRALRDEILDTNDKDDILGQLMQTVLELNRVGIAHNDVNPRNVMLQEEEDEDGKSYRATLIDFGGATVLADDGTSLPPVTGRQGYVDPQVIVARSALKNHFSTPSKGRVKGINTDMFGIVQVAMEMYEDMAFLTIDEGIISLSKPPGCPPLYTLLKASSSPIWLDRPTADEVDESKFMGIWRIVSRYALVNDPAGVHLPDVDPEPQPQDGGRSRKQELLWELRNDPKVPRFSGAGQGFDGIVFPFAPPAGAAAQAASDGDGDGGGDSVGRESGASAAASVGSAGTGAAAAQAKDADVSIAAGVHPGEAPVAVVEWVEAEGAAAAAGDAGVLVGAGVASGEAAAAAPADSAGMGAAAAVARDCAVSVAAGVESGASPSSRKRRFQSEESDAGRGSPRPRRHGGGEGSGAGADVIGAAGESDGPVQVPAAERAVQLTTRKKTAESVRAEAIGEAAGNGPVTHSNTAETRKRAAETAGAAGEGASSKRSRRR